MRILLLRSIGASLALALVLLPSTMRAQNEAFRVSGAPTTALTTPWGEPDLQGIWTVESDTPLQRSPKYANQEFFTDAQRQELDRERAALLGRDRRVERGTELDVAGAYNSVFMSKKHTGLRTSLIVDPPNGRIPPLTGEAAERVTADQDFRLALLQATQTCKAQSVACLGGKYDPRPSPRRAEPPPRYNTTRINRHDGPEDGALPDRCLTGGLPEFGTAYGGSFRRIVQTPGGISIFYEFTKQSDQENRLYYEPRCIEGNFGLPGLLHGRRVQERAFAEGRGPDPRTMDNVGDVQSVQDDPLR